MQLNPKVTHSDSPNLFHFCMQETWREDIRIMVEGSVHLHLLDPYFIHSLCSYKNTYHNAYLGLRLRWCICIVDCRWWIEVRSLCSSMILNIFLLSLCIICLHAKYLMLRCYTIVITIFLLCLWIWKIGFKRLMMFSLLKLFLIF